MDRQFEARRACRYLHIVPDCLRIPLDLQAIAARCPPPALELLGYKNTLRWMRCDQGNRNNAPGSDSGSLWPPERVYFRTVEDFEGYEEWEWLLRHHGEDVPLPIQACKCRSCLGGVCRDRSDGVVYFFHQSGGSGLKPEYPCFGLWMP